jgi:hypothetical protein
VSVLVALRSFQLEEVNGQAVKDSDYTIASEYSALVTLGLREGMSPNLAEPREALEQALAFLNSLRSGYTVNENVISVQETASRYTWFVLDGDFSWRLLDGQQTNQLIVSHNFPIKCELRTTSIGVGKRVIMIPEREPGFQLFAEFCGSFVHGEMISVDAPPFAKVCWYDEGQPPAEDTFVYVIPEASIGNVIECHVVPRVGVPATILRTEPIRASDLRFTAAQMGNQIMEDQVLDFTINAQGSSAVVTQIGIYRSRRPGDWRNAAFVPVEDANREQQTISYQLTESDVGCVIRGMLTTLDSGSPFMVTSCQRVHPAPPSFKDMKLLGRKVGLPIFVWTDFHGGVRGRCIYEWSIVAPSLPYAIPKKETAGTIVSCVVTPVREDGALGEPVKALSQEIRRAEERTQKHVKIAKRTRHGKLQLSIGAEYVSDAPNLIEEGETLLVQSPLDWTLYGPDNIGFKENTKTFEVVTGMSGTLLVVSGPGWFAIAGEIVPKWPTVSNVSILFDATSGLLKPQYDLEAGDESRTEFQWIKSQDGQPARVVDLKQCHSLSSDDSNSSYQVIVIPWSERGDAGEGVCSAPVEIEDAWLPVSPTEVYDITIPDRLTEDVLCFIEFPGSRETAPEGKECTILRLNRPVPRRYEFLWNCEGKCLTEGRSFTPRTSDIGMPISLELHDRIRSVVISSWDLPSVTPEILIVENVQLAVERAEKTLHFFTIKVSAKYSRGKDRRYSIRWFAQESNRPKELIEESSVKRKTFRARNSDLSVWVEYTPINSIGEREKTVQSNKVTIPAIGPIQIPEAKPTAEPKIVLNADFTEVSCIVSPEEAGRTVYSWAYRVDGRFQRLPGKNVPHRLIAEDLASDLCCVLDVLDEYGKRRTRTSIDIDPPLAQRFTPKIHSAVIRPVGIDKDKKGARKKEGQDVQYAVGGEQEVILVYEGPPKTVAVQWFRQLTDGAWRHISDDEKYTLTEDDRNHQVCARVRVATRSRVLSEPLTAELDTDPISVVGPVDEEAVLMGMARSMRRIGRAKFDAKLLGGESIVLAIEGHDHRARISIKLGLTVLHTSEVQGVTVKEGSARPSSCILSGTHGYRTEVILEPKKMLGGLDFSPVQARTLFIMTVRAFSSASVDKRESTKKSSSAKLKPGM